MGGKYKKTGNKKIVKQFEKEGGKIVMKKKHTTKPLQLPPKGNAPAKERLEWLRTLLN